MREIMHYKTIEQVFRELGVTDKGFSQTEAEERLKQHGPNEIKEGKKISPLEILFSQFKSVVIWILIIATIISAFLREYIDASVILVIIVLIAILGFVQEYKAENALRALKNMARTMVRVVRGGKEELIDSTLLVPGDAVKLTQGDRIPADGTLVESLHLEVNEASITGESLPVSRRSSSRREIFEYPLRPRARARARSSVRVFAFIGPPIAFRAKAKRDRKITFVGSPPSFHSRPEL